MITGNECEDGNLNSEDGCSSSCSVERGWSCTSVFPSICTTSCGDGIRAGTEECDYGDLNDEHDCSSLCF